MNWIDEYSPTAQMIEAYEFAQADIIRKCEELFAAGLRAHDAIVSLPHQNADDTTVKHGANLKMIRIRNYYASSASALSMAIDRDTADLIKWKNRFLGGSYVSTETLNTEYPHIVREIARIENKKKESAAINAWIEEY